ncbi:MAG TPA: hypothetical protein VHZ99_02760 [Steroidobacteraceae bacterium]|jgi:hypothetical protein|nr:hypothetical protein [Steroidobacteraceae bacterium]
MSTKVPQDQQEIRTYILDIARQAGLRVRPPILIREVALDDTAADPATDPAAGEHRISLISKDGRVEIRVPYGDSKNPEWRFLTRARVEDAVNTLATRTG